MGIAAKAAIIYGILTIRKEKKENKILRAELARQMDIADHDDGRVVMESQPVPQHTQGCAVSDKGRQH